jgi:hypothetical protein
MIVKNKWNGGLYEVIDDSKNEIVLKKLSDNATFTIAKSEYAFSYKPSTKKTIKK